MKIVFVNPNGNGAEVNVLKGVELRIALRNLLQSRYTNEDILEKVPDDVEDMTYEHALLLGGLPADSNLKKETGEPIDPQYLVHEDFGQGQEILRVELVGSKGFKVQAVTIIDMNSGSGKLKVDYVTGAELARRLTACGGGSPSSSTGMTPRDVVNLLRGEQGVDLSKSTLNDFKTKQPIAMDKVIDERIIMNTGMTWVSAKAIEGNEPEK